MVQPERGDTMTTVAVVGGGLAGLTAACYLARGGATVTLLERAATLGGRAATEDHEGFRFDRGIHALYTGGAATAVLHDLGVSYGHGSPPGLFALRRGALTPFPTGVRTLLRSDLLGTVDMLSFARLLATLPRTDARALARTSVADWVAGATRRPAVRQLLLAIARPFVYSTALDLVSAEVFVAKLQASFAHPIHYIDGGWQRLVDGLRRVAEGAGVRVLPAHRAEAVALWEGRACGVRLADGGVLDADAVVVATGLRDAAKLIAADAAPALHRDLAAALPARVACLDVALRRLPDARHTVVQDMEAPRFLSVQSRYARLAPDGAALVRTFKQLDPRQEGDPRADERELEAFLDATQPGWRDLVVRRVYLPRIEAVGLLPTARGAGLAGRPAARVAGVAALYLAGDWVGPEGFLADASFASGRDAARRLLGDGAEAPSPDHLTSAARSPGRRPEWSSAPGHSCS